MVCSEVVVSIVNVLLLFVTTILCLGVDTLAPGWVRRPLIDEHRNECRKTVHSGCHSRPSESTDGCSLCSYRSKLAFQAKTLYELHGSIFVEKCSCLEPYKRTFLQVPLFRTTRGHHPIVRGDIWLSEAVKFFIQRVDYLD